MTQPAVQIDGARELRAALRRAGADLSDLKDANAAVAREVAERAQATAPRRTGKLAASVKGNRAQASAVVRGGSARVPYAAPIHWGWHRRHIPANPFISKAAQDTEPVWTNEYIDAINRIVARFN